MKSGCSGNQKDVGDKPMTKTQRIALGVLSIATLVFGSKGTAMSQTNSAHGVKNIVLVHGGFVDGSVVHPSELDTRGRV